MRLGVSSWSKCRNDNVHAYYQWRQNTALSSLIPSLYMSVSSFLFYVRSTYSMHIWSLIINWTEIVTKAVRGYLRVSIISPSGSVVRLHDCASGSANDLRIDFGISFLSGLLAFTLESMKGKWDCMFRICLTQVSRRLVFAAVTWRVLQ